MTEQYYNKAMLEIDQEVIKDFFDEFNDMYNLTINAIEILDSPNNYNDAAINSIFRGIHSIKSNLRMVGLQQLANIMHHLESILEEMRQNKYPYLPEYGDLIRLILEQVKTSSKKYFHQEPMIEGLDNIANAIEHIYNNPANRKQSIAIALKLLTTYK